MSKNKVEAFVYIWRDSRAKKFYIGYHKGTPDDNYAHSSTAMESFTMRSVPARYKRRILAEGSSEEMIELELELLENRREKGRWDKYYNVGIYPYLWGDSPERRKKLSESVKAIWEDPEYRENHIEKLKAQWEDPEYREMQSKKMKAQWEDPEYREMQSKKGKARWEDPEYREMRTERVKALWTDPEYCEMQSKRMTAQNKELWKDPEFRKKHSERSSAELKKRWANPEFRKKMRGTCSVCGHESTKGNITQYHNDRCKKLLNHD